LSFCEAINLETEAFVLLSILHRMVLWELVKVFFLSFTALTGIVLMGGLVAEATQQGLGPMQVLEIIPLFIPSLLPYILPTSTLFATSVVYGRLASDNEILAIKAAGVNVMKVVWPGVFLGSVMSAVTLALYFQVIPYTHHLMRTMFLTDVKEVMYTMLKRDKGLNNPHLDFIMFVHDVQGHRLIDATFQHRDRKNPSTHDFVVRAREAELEVDMENHKLIVKMYDGETATPGGGHALFDYHEEVIDLPAMFDTGHVVRARDMTWSQLLAERAVLEGKMWERRQAKDAAEEQARMPGASADLVKHAKSLDMERQSFQAAINQIDAEFQMRPALSCGCLCFVLIGCPVGIWFSRSDYLSAFITCFLPIVFIYYPLMLCGTNYAKEGKLIPAADVWAADALIALVGVCLFGKLLRN
jgi:lipopolysaccharide export system permease protein